ncbi:MAG: hypothetical protein NT051_02190 [Candidatus Micrarchaeota archaeon]|nr:hypothetical protein [Candidatus Micrarchaeota archaeon]
MGGKKGFLTFALAAIFLLAFATSASRFSSSTYSSNAYSSLLSSHLEQVAIKQAAYSSLSDAARLALAASLASGTEPRTAIRAALYARALQDERAFSQAGYSALFWCGKVGEDSLSSAANEMRALGQSAIPDGALPLSTPSCALAFDVDMLSRKIHTANLGFCAYSQPLGFGYCASFPDEYEVDF